jgi:hypothetical protein
VDASRSRRYAGRRIVRYQVAAPIERIKIAPRGVDRATPAVSRRLLRSGALVTATRLHHHDIGHFLFRKRHYNRITEDNMHKRICSAWCAIVLGFALTSAASAGPKWSTNDAPGDKDHHGKSFTRNRGELFCPTAPLVYGNMIIPARQCYVLSVLRDGRGTFLAFVPPDAHIPPGQLVRLNTPAGPKLKGRMFLVPIQTPVVLVPINTVTLVATRIEDTGPRLAITLLGVPVPNLTTVFGVRL